MAALVRRGAAALLCHERSLLTGTPMALDAQEVLRLLQGRQYAELEARARTAVAASPGSGLAWKALSVALSAQGKEPLAALTEPMRLLTSDARLSAYSELVVVV